MKKRVSTMIAIFAIVSMGMAQENETAKIKEVISAFSKAGDAQDYKSLDNYLDDNYRVVMNRLFGSQELSVMPKSTYLDKIKSKEFGGDKRSLTFKEITINGSTASAQVSFVGQKMTFNSIILLAKDEKDTWKLISDMPMVH